MRIPLLLPAFAATGAGRWVADKIARELRARIHGAERIPAKGAALLVGNHALFGLDSVALTALLIRETPRVPRFLGEKNLWRVPGVRALLDACGAIPGVPDDAVRLLEDGEVVLVYPGGVDESFKRSREAYTLMWRERAGFAKVAARARAPIVPIAATGVDELFEVRDRERSIGRWLFGSSRYDLPLVTAARVGAVPLTFHVLAPIAPIAPIAPDGDDNDGVLALRARTFAALDAELARYRDRTEK